MLRVKRKHIISLIVVAALLLSVGFGLDNRLQTTRYDVDGKSVPAAFDGFKIAQLSDLHSLWFGAQQQDLISAVQSGKPDIIVLTGDIIDARILDYDSVSTLFEGLTKIAPVYAVSGNHEDSSKSILNKMDSLYNKYGVSFLKESGTTIVRDGSAIYIYGSDDRQTIKTYNPMADTGTYTILLYHRNDQLDQIKKFGYDLAFAGHSHGGLIRLPFIGGIVSPDGELELKQEYIGGIYEAGETTLIVNRGLAGSHNVPRIFNRPELVFVTLHHA